MESLQAPPCGRTGFRPPAHIGLGDQRFVGMAGNQQGQAQRLPRLVEAVHHDHRHIGRDIGLLSGKLVVDFAHLPDQLLVEGRHRARQQTAQAVRWPRPRTAAAPCRRYRPRQRHRPVFSAPPGARPRWRLPFAAPRRPRASIARRGRRPRRACDSAPAPGIRHYKRRSRAGSSVWDNQFQAGTRVPRAIEPFCLDRRGRAVSRSWNGRQNRRSGVGVRS